MPEDAAKKKYFDDVWYWYLTGEGREQLPTQYTLSIRIQQLLFNILPGTPRCFDCNVPLSGLGGFVVRPLGFAPSTFSPKLCNACEKMLRKYEGGTEVELTMLFADVRGSTQLAEAMSPAAYSQLIQRFYKVATDVLIENNAMVNRLMGDQVIGLFPPRFTGSNHAKTAVEAAQKLLRVTGHTDPGGAWVPVGIGVHTGRVYIGAVGSRESVGEIAVLGNEANLAARLSSAAGPGEVIVSEAASLRAGVVLTGAQLKHLELKGISQAVPVRSLVVTPDH